MYEQAGVGVASCWSAVITNLYFVLAGDQQIEQDKSEQQTHPPLFNGRQIMNVRLTTLTLIILFLVRLCSTQR